MNDTRSDTHRTSASAKNAGETKAELIARLLAKAELDYRCCGSHCSSHQEERGITDRPD